MKLSHNLLIRRREHLGIDRFAQTSSFNVPCPLEITNMLSVTKPLLMMTLLSIVKVIVPLVYLFMKTP